MKEYKVSVYMKSGNVIYIKCKDCLVRRDSGGVNIEKIIFIKPDVKDIAIISKEVECVIAKKWWQKWG